jgi:hypothetical protein
MIRCLIQRWIHGLVHGVRLVRSACAARRTCELLSTNALGLR